MAPERTLLEVTVACPSADVADTIATSAITEQLAASAHAHPIGSTYRWDNAVHHHQETLLLLTTTINAEPRLYARIRSLHPYQVPHINTRTMHVSDDTYTWAHQATQPQDTDTAIAAAGPQ